jgi:D-amino-acid dehydrogenase
MNCVANRATRDRPVLVIGGGVIGVCCAYSLRLAGIPVMLAEASAVGSGASSGNLGLLAVSHSMPLASPGVAGQALRWLLQPNSPFAIDLPPTMNMLRWLGQFVRATHSSLLGRRAALLTSLSLESVELFQEWSTSLGFKPRCSGTLEVFRTPQSVRKFRDQLPAMQRAGIAVELLNPARTRAFAPLLFQQISGGAYYPEDCAVDPLAFVNAVHRQLRDMGTELREHARAQRLRTDGDTVTAVDFENETIAVAGVVLATGFEINTLIEPLGLRMPVQAARGYTLDFPPPVEWPAMPIMFAEAKLLATPLLGRRRLGGYLHLAKTERGLPHRVTAEMLTESLSAYVPTAMVEELRRTASPIWAGFRPCSPDGLPIIGRTAKYENLYFATGHGMLGLTLAPVTGKRVVGLLDGSQCADEEDLLGPDRFPLS